MKRILPAAVTATAGTGSLAAVFAGLCCLGPVALLVLGVEGAIAAAVLKPYRWPILGVSLALLVAAFVLMRVDRHRGTSDGAGSCRLGWRRWTRRMLIAAGSVWILAVLVALGDAVVFG